MEPVAGRIAYMQACKQADDFIIMVRLSDNICKKSEDDKQTADGLISKQ